MAFLAAIPELLAGFEAIGTGVAEVTGSEFIGATAKNAAQAEVANQATSAASSFLSTATNTIFGAGTTEKIDALKHKADQIGSSFYDYVSGTKTQNELLQDLARKQAPQPVSTSQECKCEDSSTKQSPKETGKDLGTLISKTATEMSFSGETGSNAISSIYTKVFGSNPLLSYLMPSIENFQAKMVLPTNEAYQQISQVYNGKNLTYENVLETINPDGTRDYCAKDETGVTHSWFGIWNTHQVVPPIWGVWTGINSPNNAKPVSLLDLFAMLHDIDYHQFGNFNQTADYKLISRVYNNLDRFTPEEKQIALTTVKYFSTIGMSARLYSGLKGDGVLTIQDSISPDLGIEESDHKTFVDGMIEGLIHETISSSPMAPTTQTNPLYSKLLNLQLEID